MRSRFRQHTSCNTWQFKNRKRFILVLATLAAVFVGMGQRRIIGHSDFGVHRLSLIMSPITAAGLLLPVYMISDVFALSAYRRDYNKQVLEIDIIGMAISIAIDGLTARVVID
jgi:hypothetical protein